MMQLERRNRLETYEKIKAKGYETRRSNRVRCVGVLQLCHLLFSVFELRGNVVSTDVQLVTCWSRLYTTLYHAGNKNISRRFPVCRTGPPALLSSPRLALPFWRTIRRANWTFIMQIYASIVELPRTHIVLSGGGGRCGRVWWNECSTMSVETQPWVFLWRNNPATIGWKFFNG